MSDSAVNQQTVKDSQLKTGCLSFFEVLGQSIANIAPTATPAITIPVVFATAGNGTWLAYLFAAAAILLLGLQVNTFSKRTSTPGALYSYISHGLGAAPGFVSGSGLVLAYLTTGCAVLCGFANYANNLFGYLGFKVSPLLLIIIGLAAAWAVTCKGVEISARIMLAIETLSVSLITILCVIALVSHGFNIGFYQFKLKGVSFSGLSLGLVFAFFSFVGFESATTMGLEAKNPLRNIPKAVTGSGIFVGIFFILSSLVMVMAFNGAKTPLNESAAPLTFIARQCNVGLFGIFISLGAVVSFWSCSVASITAAARVMLSMSKQGILPAVVSKCHKKNKTPYIANTICALIILSVPLILLLANNSVMDVYSWTGTVSVFGFLTSYMLISIAAPVYLSKIKKLKMRNIITAAITILLLCIPFIGSVYPMPAFPSNILPLIFIGWLSVSLAWYFFSTRRSSFAKKPEITIVPNELILSNHITEH